MQRIRALLSCQSVASAASLYILLHQLIDSFSIQFRSLQPLLSMSNPSVGARVLWMSSIEASPTIYLPGDWQLIKTDYSYAASKYQMELIAAHLDNFAIKEAPRGEEVKVRHVIVQPGAAHTNIMDSLFNNWLVSTISALKVATFYMVCPSPVSPAHLRHSWYCHRSLGPHVRLPESYDSYLYSCLSGRSPIPHLSILPCHPPSMAYRIDSERRRPCKNVTACAIQIRNGQVGYRARRSSARHRVG